MPSEPWSITEVGPDLLIGVADAPLSTEQARAFAGDILDASVRAERAAKEAARG